MHTWAKWRRKKMMCLLTITFVERVSAHSSLFTNEASFRQRFTSEDRWSYSPSRCKINKKSNRFCAENCHSKCRTENPLFLATISTFLKPKVHILKPHFDYYSPLEALSFSPSLFLVLFFLSLAVIQYGINRRVLFHSFDFCSFQPLFFSPSCGFSYQLNCMPNNERYRII